MDPDRIEPSTPPRSSRSRDYLATPGTPRFGTFEDLPDVPRKPAARQASPITPARTHRRKRSANMLTPRETPGKKREKRDQSTSASEPTLQIPKTPSKSTSDTLFSNPPKVHKKYPSLTISGPSYDGANQTGGTESKPSNESEPLHPHRDQPPPNVPGMWYVFRGKRIFRPLPPGEKPLKPVTLFKTESTASEDPEEADTDVEEN